MPGRIQFFTPDQERHIEAEFWSRVNLGGDCWIWTGAKEYKGYGRFNHRGMVMWAHRFSYILFNGPIPDGLFVLHSCDVRDCVNPGHLRVGTQAENIADAISRGRLVINRKGSPGKWSEERRAQARARIAADPMARLHRSRGSKKFWDQYVPKPFCSICGAARVLPKSGAGKMYCPVCSATRSRTRYLRLKEEKYAKRA